jgi:hemoglobin
MKKDIQTEEDIRILVDGFYGKVNKDPLLSPVFNDFAGVNWEKHLPKMYAFWDSLLLGKAVYNGRPFPPHSVLPINELHFDRWIQLFKLNIDENFEGPKAEEAKTRAYSIAQIFQHKLGLL